MKKITLLLFALQLCWVVFTQDWDKFVEDATPYVEETDSTKVDWTNQWVEADGYAIVDTTKWKRPGQAKLMARSAAIAIAQRNLLETIKGVKVVSEKTVRDMVPEGDYVYTRLEGVLKGAEMVGEPRDQGDFIEVTMRAPLYQPVDKKKPEESVAGIIQDYMKKNNVDPEIDESELSKVVAEGKKKEKKHKKVKDPEAFVFEIDGKQYDASMFPIVVDENGKIIMDYSKHFDPKNGKMPKVLQMADDKVKQMGVQEGIQILEPLGVMPGGEIVIDNEDSGKLLSWVKDNGSKIWDFAKTVLMIL